MADEFLSGVQIGGNLANLGQMRAERMMQLRAQQAMQAIQERHLAAQADLLTQQTAQVAQNMKLQEDQDREEKAATLVGASHLRSKLEEQGTTPESATPDQLEEALQTTIPVVGMMPHGDKVAGTLGNVVLHLQRAKAYGMEKAADVERERHNRAMEMKQPEPLQAAARIAQLRSTVDAAQAITQSTPSPVMTPEKQAALEAGTKARYELEALQKNTEVSPQVQVLGNKRFLVNPKTGAVHEIDKSVSKEQFMAQHVGQWMRDNFGSTEGEVAKKMSDFYDQYIAPTKEAQGPAQSTERAASSKSVKVRKPDGTVGFLPEGRLDEALKAGWKKVE